MNGFGQRKFLNDGTFVADLIDEPLKSNSNKEERNCTKIGCDVEPLVVESVESVPSGYEINPMCLADRKFGSDITSGNWTTIEFNVQDNTNLNFLFEQIKWKIDITCKSDLTEIIFSEHQSEESDSGDVWEEGIVSENEVSITYRLLHQL